MGEAGSQILYPGKYAGAAGNAPRLRTFSNSSNNEAGEDEHELQSHRFIEDT